jgi:hypothetical protein
MKLPFPNRAVLPQAGPPPNPTAPGAWHRRTLLCTPLRAPWPHADLFPNALKKGEEVLSPDSLDLRWLDGLCCHFVGRSGDDRSQSEDISGHSDLENQSPTLPRSAGKLDLTGADDEDAVTRIVLLEEIRTFRKIRLHADRAEVAERHCVEITEHS